jgi:CBS domain-containing protein
VRGAADVMARERVSSVLVRHSGGVGILTDRDLRSRVVAAGRSSETPVSEVMSPRAVTVSSDTEAGEVLLAMLDHAVHHLPIVDADGEIAGVVTDTDLMAFERTTPFALKSEIQRAVDRAALVRAGRQIPDMVLQLLDAAIDPVHIGHIIGASIDALFGRMLEVEIARVGDPPVPWAWIALGSEARHEQALATDQDHVVAYDASDDDAMEVDAYFAALAEAVTSGVEDAGIPRCKAGVSATEPAWRSSLDDWTDRFRRWMNDVTAQGSAFTAIAFDLRQVGGPLRADERLREVIAEAPDRPVFLRHLARNATAARPPTGFFRDFVVEAGGEHAGRLDVKHGGITLVTSLARTHALAAGSTKIGTIERLRDAAREGRIDDDDCAGLEESFRLLWHVRVEHQCEALRIGGVPDDFVDPRTLGPLARHGLKAAFRMIGAAQRAMATDFGLSPR